MKLATKLTDLIDGLYDAVETLDVIMMEARNYQEIQKLAEYSKGTIIPAMQNVRVLSDAIETIVAKDVWPLPPYSELLFNV